MARIALSSYVVRARALYGREDLFLDDVEGDDLLEMLDGYLSSRAEAYAHDEEGQKLLTVSRLERKGRTLSGIIETGEYGYETNLYHVDRGEVTYTRDRLEAEMIPFYFLVELPKGVNEGLAILQRFQLFGIRTVLSRDLDTYMNDTKPDFRVRLNPVIAPDIWRAYLRDGRLLSISFVRFEVPEDVADALDGGHVEEIGRVEYVVHAVRRGRVPLEGRIREFLEGKRTWNHLIEITGFEPEAVKVVVEYDGSRRTLELSEPERLRALYDVSDEVTIDPKTGHPTFESIDELARSWTEDLRGQLHGKG